MSNTVQDRSRGTENQGSVNLPVLRASTSLALVAALLATIVTGWSAPIMSTVIGMASVLAGILAVQHRNHLWALIAVIAGLLWTSHLVSELIGYGEEPWGIHFAIQVPLSFAVCLLGCVGVWLGFRPYLAWMPARRLARLCMTGLAMGIAGLTLLNSAPTLGWAASKHWLGTVFVVVGTTLLASGIVFLATPMRNHGRRAELLLVIAPCTQVAIHGFLLLTDQMSHGTVGSVASMSIVVVAANGSGTHLLGTPVNGAPAMFRTRVWPMVLAALLALGASTLIRAHESFTLSAIAGALTVAAVAFALREFGAAHKPLVLPFGSRDRALQRLPNDLLAGDIGLRGRRVLRVSDGAFVAVEAEATWAGNPSNNSDLYSIADAARDANIEGLLDASTINIARAHLAALGSLEGDEPWLSIPVRSIPRLAGEADESVPVDGLVLRLKRPATRSELAELARWRDSGAWVQLEDRETGTNIDVEPEIVASNDIGLADPGSMSLIRVPGAHAKLGDLQSTGAFFAVDHIKKTSSLAELLSPIPSPTGQDEMVEVIDQP